MKNIKALTLAFLLALFGSSQSLAEYGVTVGVTTYRDVGMLNEGSTLLVDIAIFPEGIVKEIIWLVLNGWFSI